MNAPHKPGLWGAYRPLAWLGVIGIAGLIAALVGDGTYDVLSWLALGVLVVICTWKGVARQR